MTFRRVEPAAEYRLLRLLSDSGRWELGLSPYSHGTRLRMGKYGRPPSLIDFCLGHDPQTVLTALTATLDILSTMPEDADETSIDAAFPWAGTRPNPELHWEPLLAAARRAHSAQAGSEAVLQEFRI